MFWVTITLDPSRSSSPSSSEAPPPIFPREQVFLGGISHLLKGFTCFLTGFLFITQHLRVTQPHRLSPTAPLLHCIRPPSMPCVFVPPNLWAPWTFIQASSYFLLRMALPTKTPGLSLELEGRSISSLDLSHQE